LENLFFEKKYMMGSLAGAASS